MKSAQITQIHCCWPGPCQPCTCPHQVLHRGIPISQSLNQQDKTLVRTCCPSAYTQATDMCKLTIMRGMPQPASKIKNLTACLAIQQYKSLILPDFCTRAFAHLQPRQPHAVSVWHAPESAEGAAITYLRAAVQNLQCAVSAQTRLPTVGQHICVTMQSWMLPRDTLW